MKAALFFDKAPATVRVPRQMQNLDTDGAMAAVTPQFLQQNAQSSNRCPDEEGQSHKGKGKFGKGV